MNDSRTKSGETTGANPHICTHLPNPQLIRTHDPLEDAEADPTLDMSDPTLLPWLQQDRTPWSFAAACSHVKQMLNRERPAARSARAFFVP
jgi:hypothetical protein